MRAGLIRPPARPSTPEGADQCDPLTCGRHVTGADAMVRPRIIVGWPRYVATTVPYTPDWTGGWSEIHAKSRLADEAGARGARAAGPKSSRNLGRLVVRTTHCVLEARPGGPHDEAAVMKERDVFDAALTETPAGGAPRPEP